MPAPARTYAVETPPVTVIAAMIDELVSNHPDHADLETLARRAGYDPTYFHKLFTRHVGISPKQFQSYLNLKHARDLLQLGLSTETVADKINLSGTGRL
jgi:AraC family transcriptional regulator, regulatory protein of adaptative response / methylated-DNA-[protein]-cysteine methyltransferase